MAKISVLMSVFNEEKFLKEAIDSILSQTFKDFEFIIIDDGSDETYSEHLNSFKDNRIKISKIEHHGLTRALNTGLKLCEGEYVARMDSDDISHPQRLEKQVEFLEKNSDYALVGCNFFRIDEDGEVFDEIYIPTDYLIIKEKLMARNFFAHGSLMFRYKMVESLGWYRDDFSYAQDYDLLLRVSEKYKIGSIPEFLLYRRIRIGSVTAEHIKEQVYCTMLARESARRRRSGQTERFNELKNKVFSSPIKINTHKHLTERYSSMGRMYISKCKNSKGREYILKSIGHNIFCLKNYFLLVVSFLPGSIIKILKKIKSWIKNKNV